MRKKQGKNRQNGMAHWLRCGVLCTLLVAGASAHAQVGNTLANWHEDVLETRWETGVVVAGVTAIGATSWNWGSSASFRFNPEGWFGKDTGSGGADKLGHAFTSYAMTNVLADRLVRQGRAPERAALSAALTTQAVMLYVEVFDGFSGDHGFSREDVVMNLLGTGLAYARTVNPGLHELLDFRLEYLSSGYKGFRPLSDYAGQKYLVAMKLGGFNALRDTPLRFFEVQAGYYTRGFSTAERADGMGRTRHGFVGTGLNLNALLLGQRMAQEPELKRAGRLFFVHIQLPYTAARAGWAR